MGDSTPGRRIAPAALLFASLLLLVGGSGAEAAQVGFSLGVIDFSRDNEAVELGVDVGFGRWRWGLVPHAGVHATADESYYGYFGVRRPFELGGSGAWLVAPSLAVSLYERGKGKELGGPLEFRSGIELLRRWRTGGTIGLGFYHLSNSSLYDLNPGTNSLLLRIQLPPKSAGGP